MPWWGYLIIVVSILLIILIYFVRIRSRLIVQFETIKKYKSSVRIVKTKYLQVLAQTNKRISIDTKLGKAESNIHFGQPYQYKGLEITKDSVFYLAENYERAQTCLNNAINEYNIYIRRLYVIPVAKILRFKKEEYIDESKLDMIDTHGYDEDEI